MQQSTNPFREKLYLMPDFSSPNFSFFIKVRGKLINSCSVNQAKKNQNLQHGRHKFRCLVGLLGVWVVSCVFYFSVHRVFCFPPLGPDWGFSLGLPFTSVFNTSTSTLRSWLLLLACFPFKVGLFTVRFCRWLYILSKLFHTLAGLVLHCLFNIWTLSSLAGTETTTWEISRFFNFNRRVLPSNLRADGLITQARGCHSDNRQLSNYVISIFLHRYALKERLKPTWDPLRR